MSLRASTIYIHEPATPIWAAFNNAISNVISLSDFVEQPTSNKIESFAAIKQGWDYGRGGPLSAPLINAAKSWDEILGAAGAEYTDALPGDNEITVAGGRGDHYFEIILTESANGIALSFAHDVQKKQITYKDDVTDSEILIALIDALGEKWNARGWSIPKNTISRKASFSDQLSAIAALPFPTLPFLAPPQQRDLYVHTAESIPYQELPLSPLPSDALTQQPFLLIA